MWNKHKEEFVKRKEFGRFFDKDKSKPRGRQDKISYDDLKIIFLNEDKVSEEHNKWQVLEDLRKEEEEKHKKLSKRKNTEKQYEEEKKKKKKNLRKPKKLLQAIDTRGHINKIINYDDITGIKKFCEWSGPNVLNELYKNDLMEYNNKTIDKIQSIDVIIWETG